MMKIDPTDKNSYWQNELRSLGIDPKRENDLNDINELEPLADSIKQAYFQDFKSAYDYQETDETLFDFMV